MFPEKTRKTSDSLNFASEFGSSRIGVSFPAFTNRYTADLDLNPSMSRVCRIVNNLSVIVHRSL